MPPSMNGCQTLYRRLARAFPRDFRMVCSDGLERLGQDVVPPVWRQHGALGIVRLVADLVVRLPVEYVSASLNRIEEITTTQDLFEGT